jgi:hypothetical protein
VVGFEAEYEDIAYLLIDVLDMEYQDIKKHFENAFRFIEKGRKDATVFVHWFVTKVAMSIDLTKLMHICGPTTATQECPEGLQL